MAEPASLLRRLLGDDLDRLPEPLRTFHDAPHNGRGEGVFRVRRPEGLRRWLGDRFGFPPPGEAVPLVLEVRREGEGERWVRRFGDHELTSLERLRSDRLVLAFGAFRLGYQPRMEGDSLVYELRCARFAGVPLPRFLQPVERTVERPCENGWKVEVCVGLPLLGTMLEYSGLMRWKSA